MKGLTMTNYTYNQTIEYIDGTRDLNFEAARKWAQEHGTTFEEDIIKREPYNIPHEEIFFKIDTGTEETVMSDIPTIKRYFVIGDEPESYIPSNVSNEETLKAIKRNERNSFLREAQDRVDRYRNQKELGINTTDSEIIYKKLLQYMQDLRDFTNKENWWTFEIDKFEE